MGRKRTHSELDVFMNGIKTGTLKKSAHGPLSFDYDREWLNSDKCRPISLSLPVTEESHKGNSVEYFFENLLPENIDIKKSIQQRFNTDSTSTFDLLSAVGADCIGAIQLLPPGSSGTNMRIDGTPISDREIEKRLKFSSESPLGINKNDGFRISLAGTQLKTALLHFEGQWQTPNGATATTHILKPSMGVTQTSEGTIDLSQSTINEHLCLALLELMGLQVAQTTVASFGATECLVVERFDRKFSRDGSKIIRLPQEDMCQAFGLHSGQKYESDSRSSLRGKGVGITEIMNKLTASSNTSDRYRFMKTCFLFWMICAIDGHAKNHSIFIQPEGRFKLAPLYDVISAYPLMLKRQIPQKNIKMAMAIRASNAYYRWDKITHSRWKDFAQKISFSKESMSTIIEECCDTILPAITTLKGKYQGSEAQEFLSHLEAGVKKSRNKQ